MARTPRLVIGREVESEESGASAPGPYQRRQRRPGSARRRSNRAVSTAAEASLLVDFDAKNVQSLLDDYIPENEEPMAFTRADDMPPVEQRLRARSGRPYVTSVPEDMHSSLLQPGGKTALLTPCQEIILAR